jgi:LAGLIDADG DNA endonuclease family
MDDGSSFNRDARITTNYFTLEEVNLLCNVLKSRYNIIATPNKCGKNKGHIIYIHVNSMKLFIDIIKPYLLPSLYYKLGSYK